MMNNHQYHPQDISGHLDHQIYMQAVAVVYCLHSQFVRLLYFVVMVEVVVHEACI